MPMQEINGQFYADHFVFLLLYGSFLRALILVSVAETNSRITGVLAALLGRLTDTMAALAVLLHQSEMELAILAIRSLWLAALIASSGCMSATRTLAMVMATSLRCVDGLGAELTLSSSSGAGSHSRCRVVGCDVSGTLSC